MKREEVISAVIECVSMAIMVPADKMNEDTLYGKDVPVNSLGQMSISAMLGTKFSKAPSFTEFAAFTGIRDTVDWLIANN